MKRTVIIALAALLAAPALADGVVQNLITPADKARLENYENTRKAALGEARKGSADDIAILDELLARPLVAFSSGEPGNSLTGAWQCRTIKAGGLGALVVYDWFRCRVSDDGSGWALDKTSGSQRTSGRIYDYGEKRAIYLGSLRYNDDPTRKYGADPEMDQVGYAFRTGADQWRIEFPRPRHESLLDILELRR